MDENEYRLVEILMEKNEDMRVIAVGDDDQNIFRFRGSDSKYLKNMITKHDARQYMLTDNYRSCKSIVNFAKEVGFPMFIKPDIGVGAYGNFKIENENDIDNFTICLQ